MNEQTTATKYLALDPGETTGWCCFSEEGEILTYGQYKQADQTKELTRLITSDLLAVICEDYRNFAWKQQTKWSRNQTSKNIGAIEMICEMRQVPLHLQPANIKTIGYKWLGLGEAPSNHSISHQFDAMVHGGYWLISTGKIPQNYYLTS